MLQRNQEEVGKRYEWYALQRCANTYFDRFEKPKIIYIRTAKMHSFYYDEDGYYINDSCYFISTESKYLFFFLNSKLFNWYKRIKFVAYGDGAEDGRVKLEYNKMLAVPIKPVNETVKNRFENLYNRSKNNSLQEIANKEAEILIFKVYGFGYEESCFIHGNTHWITKEEYENFLLEEKTELA